MKFDSAQCLFIIWAFTFQVVLIVHFALRKWYFDAYIEKAGWLVYALCLPAVLVSLVQLLYGKSWSFWLGGFLFLIWAVFGYLVEYRLHISWRSPIVWPVFGPYVLLYLATIMFYWFPLALLSRPLWYAYAVLFVINTILNVGSH